MGVIRHKMLYNSILFTTKKCQIMLTFFVFGRENGF